MQIASSLLDSLQCEWGEFSITEIFDLKLSKGDLQPKKLESGNIPLVSAGSFNNGIVMNIKQADGKAEKFPKNVITIDMFGKSFYQDKEFYAVSHGRVNVALPKFSLNCYIGLFIVCVLDTSFNGKFGFDRMCSYGKLQKEKISLPIDSKGQPDFALMENFIKNIEQEHTQKLLEYYKLLKAVRGGA